MLPTMSGIEVGRAIAAGGGLYSRTDIERIMERKLPRARGFPQPVANVGRMALWAGEDVLRWAEGTERHYAAAKLRAATRHARKGEALDGPRTPTTPRRTRAGKRHSQP